MASEAVTDHYTHLLKELKQETKGHLFTEIPEGGFEAQYIQLLTDSVSYFIGKKYYLSDEEIQLSDGMMTVSHFNTLPLVAHLGTAVTALSKSILLEVERNIKIINRERMEQHEQTEHQPEIQRAERHAASRPANLQQQRSRSTAGQIRQDGIGVSHRESSGAIYNFENGWQSDGNHAPSTGRSGGEDRSPDTADAPAGADAADRGHLGTDTPSEQSKIDGGGNRTPERSPDSPLIGEQPNTEVAPSAAPVGEPSEKDGSFSVSEKVADEEEPSTQIEEKSDLTKDHDTPDEADRMGGSQPQMDIGEKNFDYVQDSVAYEAGELKEEPTRLSSIEDLTNENYRLLSRMKAECEYYLSDGHCRYEW